MAISYKTYSKTGELARKYVNASEGAIIYSIGKTRFMALAKEANAIYKVGNSALVNMEIQPQMRMSRLISLKDIASS